MPTPVAKDTPLSKPPVKVMSAENTGMDNFPWSVESAQLDVTKFLTEQYEDGYKYAGTITRNVGAEVRSYLVFYAI